VATDLSSSATPLRALWFTVLLGLGLGEAPAMAQETTPQEVAAWRAAAHKAVAAGKLNVAIKLLTGVMDADPSPEVMKELADVHAWAGNLTQAATLYRKLLALKPDDAVVSLALANALSWSKDPQMQREALVLFDAHLGTHPADDQTRLQRGRVRSWAGQIPGAVADFKAYLAKHPEDDKAKLELAAVLSWGKDKQPLRQALALYDAHLLKHPTDHEAQLQRARVRSWAGELDGSISDYRVCLARKDDPKVRLELGKTLGWAGRLDEAVKELDAVPPTTGDAEARLTRAMILRWGGRYAEAERDVVALRNGPADAQLRRQLDLELALIYGQTERKIAALRMLDALVAREPDYREAREERTRLGRAFRPEVTPGLALYSDKGKISVLTMSLSGKVFILPQLDVLLDVGIYRLGTAVEALWAERVDVGAGARPWDWLEIEVAGGLRTYQYFSPRGGVRLDVTGRPLASLRTSIQPTFSLHYAYDDVYADLFQPASVPAQIRGSALHGDVQVQLPYRITAAGRLGGHFLAPENSSFEASGTLSVGVYKFLSAGYYGQWIAWDMNDPAYWSPQAYVAHMALLRATQGFNSINLYYDAQVSLGTAAERVAGLPEAGYGFAYGFGGGLVYLPRPWLKLRLTFQFGSTMREIVREVAKVSSVQTSAVETVKVSESSTYWWLSTSFTAAVTF